MKTPNYYPENNNKAKAILIAGLVLIQVTLFAGENTGKYVLEDTTENEIELEDWMSNVQSSFWYDLNNAKEPEPAIESWMCNTEDSFWFDLTDAEESEPAIEDWMSNVQSSFWFDLKDTKETELALENWMTNPDNWEITTAELMLSSK